MDKRALSAIPRPALTGKNKEMLLLVPHMSYLATAARQDVNGTDTLIINFFRAAEMELKPAFRTFCQPEDYITQDLTTDKTKWKTGAINHLTGYLYWHRDSGNIVIASVKERETILGFLYDFKKKHGIDDYQRVISPERSVVDMDIECRIDEYQDAIKERKLQKKHEKEMAEIDRHMEKFGEVPEDYEQFVKDTVFADENYIFYSKAKSRAYCTKCGHEFEIRKDGLYHKKIAVWNNRDKIGHNKTIWCPYCNNILMCKSEGIGRKKLYSVHWSILVQKHGEEVLVRYFCHTKDFCTDFRNPKIESYEKYRTLHSAERARDFEWGRFKSTRNIRWCFFTDKSYGYALPPETEVPRSAVLYNKNLLEDVSGTCMKYSAVDIFIDKIVNHGQRFEEPWTGPWIIDKYFSKYREAPYLEQLLKIGFYKIAQSVIEERRWHPEFVNGRTVLETLGVNKTQFNMLRAVGDPSARDVMILRYAGTISQKDFDILRRSGTSDCDTVYKKYIDMRRYTTIYKVKRYMGKQKIMSDSDYFDYISWLEKMGYDMRNEFNLYPRDFKKAHDEKSKEYIEFLDKKGRENIERFNKLLKKLREESLDADPLKLKAAGLFVRLPENLDELKKEGEFLHHCVGTYRDKVARGETMIFFVRRESEPDKPYYTLEWKGEVKQCRGSHNCDMTPEVKAFVELFQKKMVEYEHAQERKAG